MCEEIINSWQDAGHADQIENRTGTEEDGLDECIVPSDRKTILDNVGSQIPKVIYMDHLLGAPPLSG